MDIEERVKTVLSGGVPDRIPWLIYSNHLPRGKFEREMRNMGLGLDVRCSVYRSYMPNVRVEERRNGNYLYTIYHTPYGDLSMVTRIGLRFQLPGGRWIAQHPVKRIEDIRALEFIIEDTVYEADYEDYKQVKEDLGGDGIVTVSADYTPLMKIIIQYMGFKTFTLLLGRKPDIIEGLMEKIDEKYEEMYRIIADSPAEIVRVGDNIDSVLISPKLFEKYCLPYYNKYAAILKERDKIVISHMDGRLKILKNLIARAKLDAVEAFTPPPVGDLSPREAKEAWRDKIIWMNFPETIFLQDEDSIKKYAIRLLEEIAPGIGYIISITEDIHPKHLMKGIGVVTEVLGRHGMLPIKAPLE